MQSEKVIAGQSVAGITVVYFADGYDGVPHFNRRVDVKIISHENLRAHKDWLLGRGTIAVILAHSYHTIANMQMSYHFVLMNRRWTPLDYTHYLDGASWRWFCRCVLDLKALRIMLSRDFICCCKWKSSPTTSIPPIAWNYSLTCACKRSTFRVSELTLFHPTEDFMTLLLQLTGQP